MHGPREFDDHLFDEEAAPPWGPGRRDVLFVRRHHGRGRRRFLMGPGAWEAPFPGPFFRWGPKVGRGDVRVGILVLLSEGPMHGYQIIQELGERSGGMWRPSPGSIYPTLQLLEDQGLVKSEESEGRRVFQLTDAGRAEVAKRGEDAVAPWEPFGQDTPMLELREVGFGVMTALMQVTHSGTERQIARAKEILAEARKSLYRLLAEDEPPAQGGSEPSEA
jgi:DNA-binding PadR family transcriptional regulator